MSATEERIKVLQLYQPDGMPPEASGPTLPLFMDSSWFDAYFRDALAYDTRWSEETTQLTEMVFSPPSLSPLFSFSHSLCFFYIFSNVLPF